jgi:hypothetical protein
MKPYGISREANSPCPCCRDKALFDRKVKTRKKKARQQLKKECEINETKDR